MERPPLVWNNCRSRPILVAEMPGESFDVTARRTHQWTMIGLVVGGFVLGGLLSEWVAVAMLAVAGLIMLVGRFWWPGDVVRQLVWRLLEPRGILPRVERVEDHHTRRIARVIGGTAWLASALLLALGATVAGWAIALEIGVLVLLDAAYDLCVLCFFFVQLERRGLLPAALRHT
jgi:uncharacterized membrane protein